MASVRKLPSGNYQGRANWIDEAGKRHRKSFTAETRRQALRLAEDYEATTHSTTTIGAALDAYVRSRAPLLSPSTMRSYISMASKLKTQYAPFCGLTEPSQKQAQDLVNEMIASGSSPKAIKNRIGLISSAMRFSGATFPTVTLPKIMLRSDFIPKEEDIQRIVADVAGSEMEIPIALGILGLRRSEILGLSLSDLDGCRLHIHAAKVYGSDNELHEKGTKTAMSERFIIIPDILAQKITSQGFVTDLTSHAISGRFTRIVKRLGISMRFHDLRHFFVSYCHNVLHLSDAQIMRLGGWSSDHIMKRHYLQSMHDEETASLVASSFSDLVGSRVPKRVPEST